jgi:hypothetical protein
MHEPRLAGKSEILPRSKAIILGSLHYEASYAATDRVGLSADLHI